MTEKNVEKWDDRVKQNIKAYDRMQDMVMAYAQFTIKSVLIISGGALVSIGAAYVRLITTDLPNMKHLLEITKTLASSFQLFSEALIYSITCLIIIYLSRVSFLIETDNFTFSEKVRKRHNFYGYAFEFIATVLFGIATYKVLTSLIILSAGFVNYSR